MFLSLQIVGWFLFSCILMSFIEHQVHSKLMHKRSIPMFQRTFQAHAIDHHMHYLSIFHDEPVGKNEDKEIRLTVRKAPIKALPIAAVIALVSVPGAVVFVLTATLHHWIWNKIHLEMHKPEQRGFSHWSIYKAFARYHWLHHRYPNKNFNVVFPFADFVLGTHAKATEEDRQAMRLEFEPATVVNKAESKTLVGCGPRR
ncbi:MAG TPA: hypothetical protein V6C86_16380 [Oculatellaceae cyanobacterium]